MEGIEILLGMMTGLAIVLLFAAIIIVIAEWRLLTKAGEPGWKILIPFYNYYTMLQLFWDVKWFPIFVAGVIASGVNSALMNAMESSSGTAIGALMVSIVMLVYGVFGCILSFKIGKAFGKSDGFCVGLIFLPVIFLPILAFGGSEYQYNRYPNKNHYDISDGGW